MGSMNAMGWVLVATASGSVDELWDLLNEFAERSDAQGPGIHALPAGGPRYCVHPDAGCIEVQFQDDDLHEALTHAAAWKAAQMDPDDIWRRG